MKSAFVLVIIASALFAVDLPCTLGGVAPGENVDAYVGILGYPSTQVAMGSQQIWSWGEGVLVKIDKDKTVTEVMITRPGQQKELGFDIGDPLSDGTKKLGKSDASISEAYGGVQTYRDVKTGLVLSLTINEAAIIEKISLAKGIQIK